MSAPLYVLHSIYNLGFGSREELHYKMFTLLFVAHNELHLCVNSVTIMAGTVCCVCMLRYTPQYIG